jgi:hypothetical protein
MDHHSLFFFSELHSTSETLTTHAHSSLWIHARKPYPYKHLRRLCRQILKIDEVTTDASLSTGTPPTTESTNAVKSWEIRSHGESNPGPEVLPGLHALSPGPSFSSTCWETENSMRPYKSRELDSLVWFLHDYHGFASVKRLVLREKLMMGFIWKDLISFLTLPIHFSFFCACSQKYTCHQIIACL